MNNVKFLININFALVLGFSPTLYSITDDIRLHEKGAFEDNYIKLLDVSRPLSESSLYVLSFPKNTVYGLGSFVKTFRQQQERDRLKTNSYWPFENCKNQKNSALAENSRKRHKFSAQLLSKISANYGGRLGGITFPEIQKTVVVTPLIEIEYRDLFIDPLEAPHTLN